MIVWICFILLACGVVCGIVTGNATEISNALLASPQKTLSFLLEIGGAICLFSGLMRVAEGAGLVDRFSRLLSRPVGRLMPGTGTDPVLGASVTMNLASNFFGLGNAATPYGIKACGRMGKTRITRSLATFLILNTCSLQLIPTTVCALRQAHGAENPTDILPMVWAVQIVSCTCGVLLVRIFFREEK